MRVLATPAQTGASSVQWAQADSRSVRWRRRPMTGVEGAKPASARSISDSPPQKPSSRWSRAQLRHARITTHSPQIRRAAFSRRSRADGRSPAGGKNSSLFPLQFAFSIHQGRGSIAISTHCLPYESGGFFRLAITSATKFPSNRLDICLLPRQKVRRSNSARHDILYE